MISNKSRVLILASALVTAAPAHALPTLYPSRPDQLKQVKNQTSSTVLADTIDDNQYYVLPPGAGTAIPQTAWSPSDTLGFCGEMTDAQRNSKAIAQSMADVAEDFAANEKDLAAKIRRAGELRQAAADLAVSSQDLTLAGTLYEQKTDDETRLSALYAAQNTCEGDACAARAKDVADTQKHRRTVMKQLTDIQARLGASYTTWERARQKAAAAEQDVVAQLKFVGDYQDTLSKLRQQILANYAYFAKLAGAMTGISYDTGWDQNLDRLRADNPSIHFEKSATANVVVYANLIGPDDRAAYYNSLPAVLDYVVNGVAENPFRTDGKVDTLAALPTKFNATLRLSLVGACPLMEPAKYDVKLKSGVPVFAISAKYDYPTAYTTKVKFSYNLWRFYQMIKDESSSGGLFWSSSSVKITETKLGNDTFTADWHESDPDNVVPDDQKRAIEKEVKTELINRVLTQMAVPVPGGGAAPAGTPGVPAHGAVVIASGLDQVCGFSIYCQGGAWILRGLDAIFGGSSAETSYSRNENFTASEIWNRESVRYKPGMTVMGSVT